MSGNAFLRGTIIFCLALLSLVAKADLINRTITIDGNFTDWTGTGGTYSPSGDITNNANQFNTDCSSGQTCERDGTLSSTGRDLKKFAFTWDSSNLYFYVERWVTASNATDWWFYMDTNGNGKMETGEKVIHVKWTGSNGSTTVDWAPYVQSATGGDPVVSPTTGVADGYTMPGSVGTLTNIYTASGGDTTSSLAGLRMEVRVPWSLLGGVITNMNFHISSSNGSNLPNSIIDNMDGPGNDQLFPSDLEVTKTASVSSVSANNPFTYTVKVFNMGYTTFSSVVLSDVLPSNVIYQSSSATAGSYSSSTGLWSVGTLLPQQSATLTITVTGSNVTSVTSVTNTASLSSYVGSDFYSGNNSGSATVTLNPAPQLTVIKISSAANVSPGQTLQYTIVVTNSGYSNATNLVATDKLSQFAAFRLNTFGTGQNFQFTQGTPSSGLTMGTPVYSNNGGTSYTYTPVSGGGGAPAGYDASVTNFQIPFSGSMATGSSNFSVKYGVLVQ